MTLVAVLTGWPAVDVLTICAAGYGLWRITGDIARSMARADRVIRHAPVAASRRPRLRVVRLPYDWQRERGAS